jgi:hypothetical protein
MTITEIHTILAALDDQEQECSNRYEETGDPRHLLMMFDTSALYHRFDAMRFGA